MKCRFKPLIINVAITAVISLASCQKEVTQSALNNSSIQAAVLQTQAIAVAVSSATAGDSVYVINTCSAHSRLISK